VKRGTFARIRSLEIKKLEINRFNNLTFKINLKNIFSCAPKAEYKFNQ